MGLRCLFAGDIVPEKQIIFSDALSAYIKSHDISIANLEGAFSQKNQKATKAGSHILLREEYLPEIAEHFPMLSMANNHAYDYGEEGLCHTLDVCRKNDVLVGGAGIDIYEALKPIETDDFAILCIAEHEFGKAGEHIPGIATMDAQRTIIDAILKAKQTNKKAIVFAHGGSEGFEVPPPYLRERYKMYIDFGADVVIGTHPHVVQGYEEYRERVIFYSLGNFAFDRDNFKTIKNANWSILVSIDFETRMVEVMPVVYNKNGLLEMKPEQALLTEFHRLAALLQSTDYQKTYDAQVEAVFSSWYSRFAPKDKADAALLLHYFRCDAHNHAIQRMLSKKMEEHEYTLTSPEKLQLSAKPNAKPKLPEPSPKTAKTDDDPTPNEKLLEECYNNMQQTENEKAFLTSILKNHKRYLEIGSGFSTIYFSQYVEKLVSVEVRKPWYEKVVEMKNQLELDHVELHHFPPEASADMEDGRETWIHRKPSDYGKTEEFSSYLKNIEQLLDTNEFDVVLVDGNVRKQLVELLIQKEFKGVILLHDIMPERSYMNDPIINLPGVRLNKLVDTLGELIIPPYRLEVGGTRYTPGWITLPHDQLDVTNPQDWQKHFQPESLRTVFAEHMLEHVPIEQVKQFFTIASEYLVSGGYIRLAVPDANHPSTWYHDLCRPGGSDLGSDDHKFFYSAHNIKQFVDEKTYALHLLEYWDGEGFHKADWTNDYPMGRVERSSDFYSGRFVANQELEKLLYQTTPEQVGEAMKRAGISYTSLIFDIVKKENPPDSVTSIKEYQPNAGETPGSEIAETYKTDWLAATSVFYNEKTKKVSHNVNDVIDWANFEFHPEGVKNFLEYGYSVFGQTPAKDVKFLPHSSTLNIKRNGDMSIIRRPDIAQQFQGKRISEDEIFHQLYTYINDWIDLSAFNKEVFLPLSGGYDSRLLAMLTDSKEKLRSFSFGFSDNQSDSFEVVHAKHVAEKLGINWQFIELGNYHNYFDQWEELFGISTHAHGMYQMEFYDKVRAMLHPPAQFLSGMFGDVWAGNVTFQNIGSPEDIRKLSYNHGLCGDPKQIVLKAGTDLRDGYWEKHKDLLQSEYYQVIETIRLKIILIQYLLKLPENAGYQTFAPYLIHEIALAMLNLPPERRKNRVWQAVFFRKHGLNLEDMNITSVRQHTLNHQALLNVPPKPLDEKLLSEIVKPEYVSYVNKTIQSYLQYKTYRPGIANKEVIAAYYALLTLKPLENAIKKRNNAQNESKKGTERTPVPQKPKPHIKDQQKYYDKKYYEYQEKIGAFGGWANLFKFEDEISPDDTLLDFGCGGGFLLNNIHCAEKHGLEINEIPAKQAEAFGHTVFRSIEELPENTYDIIISNHALEHVPNPFDTLVELYKALKPGGKIVFVVPHQNPHEQYKEDDVNQHLYTWNQLTLGNLFKNAGYEVKKVDAIQHQWPPNFMEIHKQIGDEQFHQYCRSYAKQQNNFQIKIIAQKGAS